MLSNIFKDKNLNTVFINTKRNKKLTSNKNKNMYNLVENMYFFIVSSKNQDFKSKIEIKLFELKKNKNTFTQNIASKKTHNQK